jgi:hypothetical protein
MAVNKKQSRSVLGDNPLSQGIFSKTETAKSDRQQAVPATHSAVAEYSSEVQTPSNGNEKTTSSLPVAEGIKKKDSRVKSKESRFLEKGEKEPVNLRLPLELNDWLNDLLKKGKRKHGSKIPKEIWVQAALELFRSMPVNWEEIEDEEGLRLALNNLESSLNNLE